MTDWGDKIDKEIDPQISWLFELAKNGLQIISMNMLKRKGVIQVTYKYSIWLYIHILDRMGIGRKLQINLELYLLCLFIKVVIGEVILKLFLTLYKTERVNVLGSQGSHRGRTDR